VPVLTVCPKPGDTRQTCDALTSTRGLAMSTAGGFGGGSLARRAIRRAHGESSDIHLSRPQPTLTRTPGITGRLLVLVGEHDQVISTEQRRQIAEALETANVRYDIVEYAGVGHVSSPTDARRPAPRRPRTLGPESGLVRQ
jgi:predicted esterase